MKIADFVANGGKVHLVPAQGYLQNLNVIT